MRLTKKETGITISIVDRNVKPNKTKSITVYGTNLEDLVKAITEMIESNAT